MSSAHRPTWSPAMGKESMQGSKIYSSRDLAAHTRLKFRQPGQGSSAEVARRDLKLELAQAEREANAKKAKGQSGISTGANLITNGDSAAVEADSEEAVSAKRRKVLADVGDLDKDDDDSDEDEDNDDAAPVDKGKGRAKSADVENGKDSDEDDDDSDDDDDEDETAELLRELEKIKRERAEEREKQERERAATEQVSREEEIAMGNPLLNLQSALNYSASPTPSSISSSAASSFGVKRRWDDDVIFKNQARGTSETPKSEFVNDLLRTNFHRRFMKRFIA